jgi:alpha-1,2-mannosyltransferase
VAVGAEQTRAGGPWRTADAVRQRFGYMTTMAMWVIAVWVFTQLTVATLTGSTAGFDLHIYLRAGDAVIAGVSPYPPLDREVLAGEDQFVYPAAAAVLLSPFGLLPPSVVQVLWYAAGLAAGLGAFWVVGVRDARVYLAIFCSKWFENGIFTGTVMPFLGLGIALAWRWRDTAWRGATVLAVITAVKLLPGPLVVWLWATGRRAQALRCLGVTLAVLAAGWAVLGFSTLSTYPRLLDLLGQVLAGHSYSLTSLGLSVGAPFATARLVAAAVAAVAIAAAWRLGRMDGRHGFLLCAAAAVLASPIVWTNYLTLVMVGVALHRPRMSWVWLVPILLGVGAVEWWNLLIWNGAIALIVLHCVSGADTRLRSIAAR